MSDVAMTPVQSGHSEAIGRNGPHLRIKFNNGPTWEYKNAGHHYDEMLKSDSKGKYFHAKIKGKYEGSKIE
jgi:KTSC domain